MNKKKRIMLLAAAGVVLLGLVIPPPGAALNEDAGCRPAAAGNTAFALDLYRELKDTDGNMFFSPYSISTALAMTYGGARGGTAKQMAGVLYFTLPADKLHPAFQQLEAKLETAQKTGGVRLNVANSLWPQKDYPFLAEYMELVKKYYGVSITPVDYQRAAETARGMINRWVEDKTANKIKELIKPGILTALTRLVLVNAIYFKGDWASQFDAQRTQEAPFFLLSGETAQVPLMTQKRKFKYAGFESLQVLELPYSGDRLSMLVLLPKKKNGLAQLEAGLTARNLEEWTTSPREREVEVFLPKFKMTSLFRLGKTLAAMGMGDAFDPLKANFSGMDGRLNWLYIGAVIHKAYVDVNEEGTEAAASTAVVMRIKMSKPLPPETFRADHPFIFLIRENQTNSILFIGRVVEP
jgi:serpin B